MKHTSQILMSICLPVLSWIASGCLIKGLFLYTIIFGALSIVVWILLLRSFAD